MSLGLGMGLWLGHNPATSGGGGGTAWQFSNLTTPARIDLNANSLAGADGSTVSTFTDQMGNYNATLASGTGPKLRYAAVGSLKAVEYTATDAAQMTLSSALLSGATAGSYIALVKLKNDPPAGDSDSGAIFANFTSDTSTLQPTHFPYSDGNVYEHFGVSNSRLQFNPTPSLSSTYRAIYVEINSGGDLTVYIDETQASQSLGLSVGFGAVTRSLGFAKSGAGAFFYLNGYIARALVFDYCLATSDRQKAGARLLWDAGLQSQLPGGHPYASVAP